LSQKVLTEARKQAMSSTNSTSLGSQTFRRIITAHRPTDRDVVLHDDNIPLRPVLNGNALVSPLFAHLGIPAQSTHSLTCNDIEHAMTLVPGVVTPGGVNGQVTDLAPNFKVDMHRTNSIDYNVFLAGSAWLITPTVEDDGSKGEKRTLVKAGEVVVQRGTIHAWEAGPEGARWCTVVVAALPISKDGIDFEEVDFQ
jgi:hypothetical protein